MTATVGLDYRLTDDDEEKVQYRIDSTVAEWTSQAWPQDFAAGPEHYGALVRLAAHAIGCSTDDLRQSELDWIDARVAEALA